MTSYLIPILLILIFAVAIAKKVDVFSEFISGAADNLKVSFEILPTLVALVLSIGMLRASGVIDFISNLAAPLMDTIGFPSECLPLALIRPVSGSGATAVYENILNFNSPDSFSGRVASVMIGSTETTFYTIAVYFGATKIKNTRHTLGCSLTGDFIAIAGSVILVKLFWGIC